MDIIGSFSVQQALLINRLINLNICTGNQTQNLNHLKHKQTASTKHLSTPLFIALFQTNAKVHHSVSLRDGISNTLLQRDEQAIPKNIWSYPF